MMGKLAFIFPGQGSQYAGMGKEIFDAFPCARETFDEANQASGLPISELCFHGPEESLKLTQNTQPAILTVSVAIWRVLQELGFEPYFVAGHSLGEYSALVCAGSLSLADAVRIVRKRGRYMQEAVPPSKGAMAAVLGLEGALVAEACKEASGDGVVAPANFNAPDQIVIAGDTKAVGKALERAKEKGAKRIIPLAVSAPFHCDLLAPARDRLAVDLRATEFRDLKVPLVANVDAVEIRTGDAARDSLIRQVCMPVRWVESIQYMASRGADKFVEVGPGRVLIGLVKKILTQAVTCNVDGIRGVEALASVLASAKM